MFLAYEAFLVHVAAQEEQQKKTWKSECTCHKGGYGYVSATMKNHEDGDRSWTTGTSCPDGSALWSAAYAEVGFAITEHDERLNLYPRMTPPEWDASELGMCVGVHETCGGFVDHKPVSRTSRAIHCRACGMRVVIPATVKTVSDLRAWAAARLAP